MTQGTPAASRENNCGQEAVDPRKLAAVIRKHSGDRGALIAILEDIQDEYGYLSEKALRTVADMTGRSLVDIFGVATFYRSFSLKPRGKHLISACLGTACHVRGAQRTVEELERELGIRAGETTPDGEFTLETVNCLGACALGPTVVIDGHYFSKVRESRVGQLLDEALKGFDSVEISKDKRVFPVDVNCPHCNHSLKDESFAIDDHPSIRVTVSFGRKRGWLRLSSLYGSHNSFAEHEIPEGAVTSFFCPRCCAELTGKPDCPKCGAPMVTMLVCGGGTVQICSRHGCTSHMLDLGR